VSRKQAVAQLQTFVDFFAGVDPSSPERLAKEIEYFLSGDEILVASLARIAQGVLLTEQRVEECLAGLLETGRVLRLAADGYLHADHYASCLETATNRIKEVSARPDKLDLAITDLRAGLDWGPSVWNRVQEDLESAGLIARRGGKYVLVGAVQEIDDGLDEADRELSGKLLALYQETGFKSPRPDELPELLRARPERIERLLELLCAREALFRVGKNVMLSREWLVKAQALVIEHILKNGVLDSGVFKNHLDSTRKYALAILDWLDSRMITVRRGNDRRLTGNYQKNML
jgi:selenocysteine-specific elongation factor